MKLRNSLRVLHGRNRIHAEELEQALTYIDEDIATARLQRLHPDPMLVESQIKSSIYRPRQNFKTISPLC